MIVEPLTGLNKGSASALDTGREADRLGIVFFPAFDWAISPTHPEREERLLYTLDQLQEEGLFDLPGISLHPPDLATPEDIANTHFCLPELQAVCAPQHFASAGGAIKAGRLVLEGHAKRAFALVRPPGHHAMRVAHGCRGFCNINNEAVLVHYLRRHFGVKRIAVIDTDCHHGDGTQDIFWHDPDTLFISIHQDGRTLYPGTGFTDELGGPGARGKTLNIPLPPETSDSVLLRVVENIVLPILKDFKPDLVINSAGQDNHYGDPITNMRISAQGYARMTELLQPDLAVLEGGYSIHGALPYVNLGLALALAGHDYSGVCEPDYQPGRWENSKIDAYADTLTELMLELYFNPPAIPVDGTFTKIDGREYFVRQRHIYYDTSGISEIQNERLLLCPDCSGLLLIESRVENYRPYACIHIMHDACKFCVQSGFELYEVCRKSGNYADIQLQNHCLV